MSTETHPQAALFRALADHLDRNPTLPAINVSFSLHKPYLQIAHKDGKQPSTPEVLAWGQTLIEPTIAIGPHGEVEDHITHVEATGRLGAVTVSVWTVDRDDLYRLYDSAEADWLGCSPISLDALTRYVATGTVDGVTP